MRVSIMAVSRGKLKFLQPFCGAQIEIAALRDNNFRGPIWDSFGNFQDLVFADFGMNMFTGPLPTSIFSLPKIRILYFFENELTGEIPSNFADSAVLRDLYLHNNSLSGRVPPIDPTQLSVFTEFRIEYNDITGSMPASICALRGPNKTTDLVTLHSDCGGDDPEIRCDCCTECYPLP